MLCIYYVRWCLSICLKQLKTLSVHPGCNLQLVQRDLSCFNPLLLYKCAVPTTCLVSLQVPAPGGWQNGTMPETVLKALEDLQHDQPQTDAEALRFPLSCSEVQADTDKQGQPCSTIDCIVHSDILTAAQQHRPLKAFLIELALGWVGNKHKMELNPKFKLPKMTYKGEQVRPQRVRMDKKPLVTDVTADTDEEPSFPLLPTKPAAKAAVSKAASQVGVSAAAPAAAGQPKVQANAVSNKQANGSAAPTAVAAAMSAGGALGITSSSGSSWPHEVKCEGKPVSHMVVTVQLPKQSSSSSWTAAGLKAEVSGQQLRIGPAPAAAAAGCVVQLPFAASGEGATAEVDPAGQLVFRLPYLPVQNWVEQLVSKAPHAFADLPLAHASYMELDELE